MQDVDRPAHIQAFPQPTRARCPRVEAKPERFVLRSHVVHGIIRQLWRRWRFGQWPAVRAPESQLAVGLAVDLVALLVNGAVVSATEQGQVRERGRPSLCPMADVMALAERKPAAREAAALIAVVEHAS